jgi:hypothetical protein
MKGITVPLVTVALTMIVSSLPSEARPAVPGEIVRKPQAAWPKWYYYDQLGLREWYKGNKQAALNYFDQSYKYCEAAMGSGSPVLDQRTKQMVGEVINHQQFHLTVWNEQRSSGSAADIRMTGMMLDGRTPAETERQMAFMDKLETFAKRTLGKNHLNVQAIARYKNLNLSDDQKKLAIEKFAAGKPNLGTTMKPKWYTNNERDFTPEMFTRNPRRVVEPGDDRQKRMDVTKIPEERVQKGFSYVGGQKIDLSKKLPPPTNGWGSSTTVGNIQNNDKNAVQTGWGNEPKNSGDPRLQEASRWGVKADDIIKQKDTKKTPWGHSGTEQDPIKNSSWGAQSDDPVVTPTPSK